MTFSVTPSAELLAALASEARKNDGDGTFPHHSFDLLAKAGLTGAIAGAPDRRALDLAEALAIVRAVAERDPTVALLLSFHYSIVNGIQDPASPWPEAAKRKVLDGVRERGELINNIVAEPELGGQTHGGIHATRLVPDGTGGYRLTGHKIYATGISRIRWATLPVSLEDGTGRRASVLLDTRLPGISIRENWDSLGMRATRSDDLILQDVAIAADDILETGEAGQPRELLQDSIIASWAQVLMPSIYDGTARAARNWFATFLQSRVPSALGRPLASLERFQESLGEIDSALFINDTLIQRALDAISAQGRPSSTANAVMRVTVIRHATQIVTRIAEIAGNRALQRGEDFERHFRNAIHASVHSPTTSQLVRAIGQAGLRDAR